MTLRLGDVLVRLGALSLEQRDHVLQEQARCGRPFGVLAEEMYGVCPSVLEQAWAEQYASIAKTVDPTKERVDPAVLSLVSRRQAWQFMLLPLRGDGSEIMVCTCKDHFPRALRFAYRHLGPSCYFVMAEEARLVDALDRHMPMPGAREHLATAGVGTGFPESPARGRSRGRAMPG